MRLSPEFIHGLKIDRVEALADTKQEDADDDESYEYRKRDADLDNKRHAFCACRGKDQAVFKRHESDNLADGVAPRDHHQEAEQIGRAPSELQSLMRTSYAVFCLKKNNKNKTNKKTKTIKEH